MRTVLVFGTFDRLHEGHLRFLERARSFGERLVVSLARDSFVRGFKGKKPLHTEQERRRRLSETGLVEEVLLSDEEPGSYRVILEVEPDLICLGYDQSILRRSLEDWMQSAGRHIPVRLMEYFPVPPIESSRSE